jgi:hypothetical protein
MKLNYFMSKTAGARASGFYSLYKTVHTVPINIISKILPKVKGEVVRFTPLKGSAAGNGGKDKISLKANAGFIQ